MSKKKLIIDIMTIVFIFATVFAMYRLVEPREDKDVKEFKKTVSKETTMNPNIDWEKLQTFNKDIVGWIYIPGTDVNYPVLCSKESSKYLNVNWKGIESMYGSIYLDSIYYGKNITELNKCMIHGHNVGPMSTVMFSTLRDYANPSFVKGRENIYLYTPDGNMRYNIVSIKEARPDDTNVFSENNENIKEWLKEQNDTSDVRTELKGESDKAILLSTCSSDNMRFVIIGELVETK